MSRKSKSFSQLYDYLTRDKSSFTFSRNTYSNSKNKKEFVNEFYENSRHLREARSLSVSQSRKSVKLTFSASKISV
ncbi:hypothetical protein KKG72_00015 [bacterium]|nr:hypothetical protein [bacterium]